MSKDANECRNHQLHSAHTHRHTDTGRGRRGGRKRRMDERRTAGRDKTQDDTIQDKRRGKYHRYESGRERVDRVLVALLCSTAALHCTALLSCKTTGGQRRVQSRQTSKVNIDKSNN